MKITLLLSLLFLSLSTFASSDLPYTKYYGEYEVLTCKEIEAKNPERDLCSTAKILIRKAEPCMGAPSNRAFFASKNEKFYGDCSHAPNVALPKEFVFSNREDVNSETYKYEQEDNDKFEHYYRRATVTSGNTKFYDYFEYWMKRNEDKTITAKIKQSEALIDSPETLRNSFEYEFKLKPAK